MTLPLPQLDKRDWSDLVDEGLARIPRRAPEWTDHNLHDPGISLLELLAYKTDQTLYQANRVTERLLENVYQLLSPKDDSVQTSIVFFPSPVEKSSSPVVIEPGELYEMVRDDAPYEDSVPPPPLMRTKSQVTPQPTKLKSLFGAGVREITQQLSAGAGSAFQVTYREELPRVKGHGDYLFTIALSDPLDKGSKLSIFFEIEGGAPEVADDVVRVKRHTTSRYSLRWFTGKTPVTYWEDETDNLSKSGIVELTFPHNADVVKCRWTANVPWPTHRKIKRVVLNAARIEHVSSKDHEHFEPKRESIDLREHPLAFDVDGFGELDLELPVTRLEVVHESASVASNGNGNVHQNPNWTRWLRCQSLMLARPDERSFELEGSVLRFGNGRHGAKLPDEGRLVLSYDILQPVSGISVGTRWVACNKDGNAPIAETVHLPPQFGLVSDIRESILTEARRASASTFLSEMARENGGSLDGLPLNKILSIPSPLHAVTASDYERLAFDTRHIRILRAKAFPEVDVSKPGLPGGGVLSLVVLPDMSLPEDLYMIPSLSETREDKDEYDKKQFDRLITTALTVTEHHLRKYRTIGTKLVVSIPKFSRLLVEIEIAPNLSLHDPDFEIAENEIRKELQKYFHPTTGGSNHVGCPMGELLSQRDIYAVVSAAAKGFAIVTCRVAPKKTWLPWSLPLAEITISRASDGFGRLN
jgi:hypothetical protein